VKIAKSQWGKLTLKEKSKLLRKAFFRTERRISRDVTIQKQEEIET
jgi:hypothetical protein